MMKHLRYMAFAAIAMAGTACSEGPTDVNEEFEGELVITEGVAAPEYVARERPVFAAAEAQASVGGSVSTPLTLLAQSCGLGATQQVQITYTIDGQQRGTGSSFKVYTVWTYNGTNWIGSSPATVNVPARSASDPDLIVVKALTVTNGSAQATGTSTVIVTPFDVANSLPPDLNVSNAGVSIFVTFDGCTPPNTPPTLILPADITAEATSSAGASVTFTVTANDLEDGDLTSQVSCVPSSGSTFPLGSTTVNCSVTDNGGLEATGSFSVKVEDTTPPVFTSFPTGTLNTIAANIDGALIDLDTFNIVAADFGGVSEPTTVSCDYVAGTVLRIGSTTPISCTATDAIGNESDPSTFDVFVGLNVSGTGFLAPLRMIAPFSAHKRGSTIPHKFLPPTYADGTPAIDLAGGLNLTLRRIDASVDEEGIDGTEYAAGSTAWRYDPESGHYIFNLKTGTATPWDLGTWTTTASYAGITLATTRFDLKR